MEAEQGMMQNLVLNGQHSLTISKSTETIIPIAVLVRLLGTAPFLYITWLRPLAVVDVRGGVHQLRNNDGIATKPSSEIYCH